jgi:monoamine oxidase
VKVTTKKGVYYGKKVISSLPLGVIQAKKVKFLPGIPLTHSLALFHLAPGNENKLFVSFEKPFWNASKKWLNFVTKGQHPNDFPVAYVMSIPNKHALTFFLSGDTNVKFSGLSNYTLKKKLLRFLCNFVEEDLKINDLYMTRWH